MLEFPGGGTTAAGSEPLLVAMVMSKRDEVIHWTMTFADDTVICERWRFSLERRGRKVSEERRCVCV